MECKQCGKEIQRGFWCSDKCRMANKRAVKPEQIIPEQPKANKVGPKCFEDLPAHVQRSINRLSDSPEEKARRTSNAIAYQQRNPGRTQNTGLDIGEVGLPEGYKPASELKPGEYNRVSKPGDDDYPAGQGLCRTCGAETQIKAITKCHQCVEAA